MENRLSSIIDRIIDLIENDEYKAYKFLGNRLLFKDKEQNIDLQAKFGYNNYFIKDNISNSTYIKTKKFLDKDTTIQQIYMDEGINKNYYSFIERDAYISLARVVKVRGKDSIVCINNNIANHTWEDILKYSKSIFEFQTSDVEASDIEEFESYFDGLINRPSAENDFSAENSEEDKEKYNSDYDFEDEYDDNYDGIDVNENDDDYDDEYDDSDGIEIESDDFDDEDDYSETELEQHKKSGAAYEKFELYSNGIEIDDEAKGRIIYELESLTELIFDQSLLLDRYTNDLKAVIDAKMKKEELEK